jgi:hypothetical protein
VNITLWPHERPEAHFTSHRLLLNKLLTLFCYKSCELTYLILLQVKDWLHYLCSIVLKYVDEHLKGKPRYKQELTQSRSPTYYKIDLRMHQEVHSSPPPLTQILWGLVCSSGQIYVHFLTINLIQPAISNTQHAIRSCGISFFFICKSSSTLPHRISTEPCFAMWLARWFFDSPAEDDHGAGGRGVRVPEHLELPGFSCHCNCALAVKHTQNSAQSSNL